MKIRRVLSVSISQKYRVSHPLTMFKFFIKERLNHRPRKCYDYKIPAMVFFQLDSGCTLNLNPIMLKKLDTQKKTKNKKNRISHQKGLYYWRVHTFFLGFSLH